MFDFVRLPGEIRNAIYKNLLVEDPVIPWAEERPWVNREPLHINLAYTTKAIHDEWTSIFYSEITFDFRRNDYACGFECSDDVCELQRTAMFLERIDRNARHIRHILTQFPDYYYDKHKNEYRLFGHSSRLVDMFQINCPSLKRLCFGPMCSYSEFTRRTAFNNEAQAAMLLSLIDRHFRTITSLETIAVKVPDCDPYNILVAEIKDRYRWDVEMIPKFRLPSFWSQQNRQVWHESQQVRRVYQHLEEFQRDLQLERYQLEQLRQQIRTHQLEQGRLDQRRREQQRLEQNRLDRLRRGQEIQNQKIKQNRLDLRREQQQLRQEIRDHQLEQNRLDCLRREQQQLKQEQLDQQRREQEIENQQLQQNRLDLRREQQQLEQGRLDQRQRDQQQIQQNHQLEQNWQLQAFMIGHPGSSIQLVGLGYVEQSGRVVRGNGHDYVLWALSLLLAYLLLIMLA